MSELDDELFCDVCESTFDRGSVHACDEYRKLLTWLTRRASRPLSPLWTKDEIDECLREYKEQADGAAWFGSTF